MDPEIDQLDWETLSYADAFYQFDTECRAKYKKADRDEMAKSGEAMSDGSYPIRDEEDLKKAIKAVGRGNASHDSIRKHIINRAKALKLSSLIPDTWNSDGSIKEADAAPSRSLEWRKRKAAELRGTERRVFHVSECRMQPSDDDPDVLHFSGYASMIDVPYDMGFYTEKVAKGAFTKTLSENPDIQLLTNHGGLPLARTKSGTMTVKEDNIGLKVDADLDAEDPDVKSLARKMNRGDIDQMSMAFRCILQQWNEDYSERTLVEVSLDRGDVSVVNMGASPTTMASVRADDARKALHHLGAIGVVEAFFEGREGRELSPDATEVLTRAVELAATDEDEMAEAGALIAERSTGSGPLNPERRERYLAKLSERAAVTFDDQTMARLQGILDLIDASDTNVDKALVALSGLMGVVNPDIAQDAALDRGCGCCDDCTDDCTGTCCDDCTMKPPDPNPPSDSGTGVSDGGSGSLSLSPMVDARRSLDALRHAPRRVTA